MNNFQIAIIGGGVIGSAISWELSKYNLDVIVFEKGSDVASETSKANSGVIHSGINSPPGSLKAYFCTKGNNIFPQLSKILGFRINYIGKYVIAKNDEELSELERLKNVGIKNNILNLEIIDGKNVKKKNQMLNVIKHYGFQPLELFHHTSLLLHLRKTLQ